MDNRKGIILFVDDEFFILQTFKAIFRRDFKDYELLFAQSGEEALGKLKECAPDSKEPIIVFSDWLMPGIKGDELLVKIHEQFPQSVGFLLSGMINREPTQEIFERANIKRVIVKPWDNEELKSIVTETLNQ